MKNDPGRDQAPELREQIKTLCIDRAALFQALKLARKYVAKATADGAYAGCAWSGTKVLEMIDMALYAAGVQP